MFLGGFSLPFIWFRLRYPMAPAAGSNHLTFQRGEHGRSLTPSVLDGAGTITRSSAKRICIILHYFDDDTARLFSPRRMNRNTRRNTHEANCSGFV